MFHDNIRSHSSFPPRINWVKRQSLNPKLMISTRISRQIQNSGNTYLVPRVSSRPQWISQQLRIFSTTNLILLWYTNCRFFASIFIWYSTIEHQHFWSQEQYISHNNNKFHYKPNKDNHNASKLLKDCKLQAFKLPSPCLQQILTLISWITNNTRYEHQKYHSLNGKHNCIENQLQEPIHTKLLDLTWSAK